VSGLPLGGSHDHRQEGDRYVVLALSEVRRGLESGAARRQPVLAAALVTKIAAAAAVRGRLAQRR
jgi:hypothetical protein